MPGPSFSTPRPVRPSLPRRRFTVAAANKTLPLVRRVVSDIVHTHDQALQLQATIEKSSRDGVDRKGKTTVSTQSELDSTMDRLDNLVEELTEIGCELKDYQTGLIDFVGRHQGRDVYLCWKLGEEKISYWHELNAGFAGRKPIAVLEERE